MDPIGDHENQKMFCNRYRINQLSVPSLRQKSPFQLPLIFFSFVMMAQLHQYIEINPKIMMGKPVIKGTRITVEQILENLAANSSIDDVLTAHPHLTKEQIHAALAFAAESLRGDEILPIAI